MTEYYYLKKGNLIYDRQGRKKFKMETFHETQLGIAEFSNVPINRPLDMMPYDLLVQLMDEGKLQIVKTVYENDRDKILLLHEIDNIKKAKDIKALGAQLTTAEDFNTQLKEKQEDTLAGMEALAKTEHTKAGDISGWDLTDKHWVANVATPEGSESVGVPEWAEVLVEPHMIKVKKYKDTLYIDQILVDLHYQKPEAEKFARDIIKKFKP